MINFEEMSKLQKNKGRDARTSEDARALKIEGLAKQFEPLERSINYSFKDKKLLILALTHSSYANRKGRDLFGSNERIEFLGDGILEIVSSELLHKKDQEKKIEGLARIRTAIVCEKSLVEASKRINLDKFLLINDKEKILKEAPSVLADGFEALIGAIYLDGGIDEVKKFIAEGMEKEIQTSLEKGPYCDYKQELGRESYKRGKFDVRYDVVSSNDKETLVNVYMDGKVVGTGVGRTKKIAQQKAAREALKYLRLSETGLENDIKLKKVEGSFKVSPETKLKYQSDNTIEDGTTVAQDVEHKKEVNTKKSLINIMERLKIPQTSELSKKLAQQKETQKTLEAKEKVVSTMNSVIDTINSIKKQRTDELARRIRPFEDKIKYNFKDKQLIISALIHHSYIVPKMKYLSSSIYLNKKLKFLGCASLKMLIAEFLYKNNRNMNEGKMTSLRGRILSRTSFQRVAKNMELDKWLLVGNYNEKGIGNSMLVDGFEALIGAIYLDGGLEQVKEFVLEVVNYPPPEGGWACNYPVVVTELTSDLFLNEKVLIGDVASQGD